MKIKNVGDGIEFLTQIVVGVGLMVGAAGLWHYWGLNGFISFIMGFAGILLTFAAFDNS